MDLQTINIILYVVIAVAVAGIIALSLMVFYYAFFRKDGTVKVEQWREEDELNPEDIIKLVKANNEEFKILQLSDMQLKKNDIVTEECFATVSALIDKTKPDLIVTVGDNVEGLLNFRINKSLIDFLDGFGIPWATVFGNHDAEGVADRSFLGNQFVNAKNCLFKFGPSNIKGYGNYVINIVENNNDAEKIIYSLNFIDSNRYKKGSRRTVYDCIGADQLEYLKWYNDAQKQHFNDNDMPSMGFFHIAPMEVSDYYNKLKHLQNENIVKVPNEDGFGEFREEPCPSDINTGIVETAALIGMKYIFIGHDHVNNASFKTDNGVVITYGLKTGYGSYGDKDLNGGTLISIGSNRKVSIEHINLAEKDLNISELKAE